MSDQEVIGKTGLVSLGIDGRNSPGLVTISIRGGIEMFTAIADSNIAKNSEVVVVESYPSRVLLVKPTVTLSSLKEEYN